MSDLLKSIEELRVFAVIRTDTAEQAVAAGRACVAGGVKLLEVTLTVPGALEAVRMLRDEPDAIVGEIGRASCRERV